MMGSSIHAIKVSYVFTNLNQFVVLLIYVCIVGIGGYKVSTGSLSVGFFSIINTYFNMIISSISYFIGLAGSYQDAKISFQRIEKILKSPDEEKGEQGIDSIQKVECKDFFSVRMEAICSWIIAALHFIEEEFMVCTARMELARQLF